MFPKALGVGADIVCIDLEDAVAPHDKDDARTKTLALFDEPQASDGVERIVRINPLHTPRASPTSLRSAREAQRRRR